MMQGTDGQLDARLIPAEIIDDELARRLFRIGIYPRDIPEEVLTKELCLDFLSVHPGYISFVPKKLQDEEVYIKALANEPKPRYDLSKDYPDWCLEPTGLKQALDINFDFINHVPGNLVKEEVYEYAHSLAPSEEEWDEIVSRHGQVLIKPSRDFDDALNALSEKINDGLSDESDGEAFLQMVELKDLIGLSTKDRCWYVFWDEDFLIDQVYEREHNGRAISVYDIPDEKWTQRLSEEAVKVAQYHIQNGL
jgi:hypothetical protein